jgi:hypothetical protein
MPDSDAGIAQLVEHDLAKVGVASSSLVSRSKIWIDEPLVRASIKKEASASFFVPAISLASGLPIAPLDGAMGSQYGYQCVCSRCSIACLR